jgi:hypothetical protein
MIVQLKRCPDHGRRETAILMDGGTTRCCDAPSGRALCGRLLTLDTDASRVPPRTAFDREVTLVRQDWPGEEGCDA